MSSVKKEIDLDNAFQNVNIKKGDKILVTSSILKILVHYKKKRIKFNPNLIIDSLIRKIGPNGTLLFPTYNWDFCKGKGYDYQNTKSLSGALGNFALKRKEFKRTKNPIYSYAVAGKDRDLICDLKHYSCFGLDSPFGYLIKNKGKNLFIGIDYKDGFTLIHVAEETIGVDYRYFKNFTGKYFDGNKSFKATYKMYVRELNKNISMTAIDKKFDKVLINKKAYIKKTLNGIIFTSIDINKAYQALLYDLKNKKGLIYPKKSYA